MTNSISFPGLGIGEFQLDPVAFTIPGLDKPVMWYGIIITCGIILAVLYVLWRCQFEGIAKDHIYDLAIFVVIAGVLGARLYYVIFEWKSIVGDSFGETLYNTVAIWQGGLAIYGGIIGGALAIIAVTKSKRIATFKVFDMVVPAVMLGQLIGRFGNFTNGEAFGGTVAEGHPLYFLRMGLISRNTMIKFGTSEMVYVHPTFLYESLWNLLGFVLINLFYKKKKYDGQVLLWYLTWYGFGRMLIEGLRMDSLYIFGTVRVSQLVGFICFVLGGTALIVCGILCKKGRIPATASGAVLTEGAAVTDAASMEDTAAEEIRAEEQEADISADKEETNQTSEDTEAKENDHGKDH